MEPNWSWIGRTIHRLIPWHHEGAISREVLQECMDYAHSRQDPETGFWANGVQTTFKLLIPVHARSSRTARAAGGKQLKFGELIDP